jgi:hypothetical protein
MAMLDSGIQTRLSQLVARQLESVTNSEIQIGHIYLKPFRTLELNDVYVSDDQKDTLLYIKRLTASITWLGISSGYIWLDEVNLHKGRVYFNTDSTGEMNLLRFINSFGSSSADTSSSDFTLRISNIAVDETNFRLTSYNPEYVPYGMNYEDMFFKNLSFKGEEFKLVNSDVFLNIQHLSGREQCGLVIDTIRGYYAMDSTGISMENTLLQVDSTRIKAKYYRLLFSDFAQMSDFLNEVEIESNIEEGYIRTDDIAWFVPDFKEYDLQAQISGEISGTVSHMKASNLKVALTDSTFIHTSLSINGLPDIETAFIYGNVHSLAGYSSDLALIAMLADSAGNSPLPPQIRTFRYAGNVSGFLSDLVVDGTLYSNVGNVRLNVNYRENDTTDMEISGFVHGYNIRVDQLAGSEQMLGKTSFKSNIDGKFKPNGNFSLNLDVEADYFDFNQYRIHNIRMDGLLTEEAFNGDIVIADSALDINFTGHFEYATELLNQRFLLNVRYADFSKLNLDIDSVSVLSCDIMANVNGLDVNTINGDLNVLGLDYKRGGDSIFINEINLQTSQTDVQKSLQVSSDFFDIDFSGRFLIENISPAVSQLVEKYSPQTAWDTTPVTADKTEFRLRVNMINIQPLIKLFVPNIAVSNNTNLTGRFDREEGLLLIEARSDYIEIAGMTMNKVDIRSYNLPNSIQATVSSRSFNYVGEYALSNLKVSSTIQPDSLDLNLNWDNSGIADSALYSGNISASVGLSHSDSALLNKFAVNFDPSYFVVSDTLWSIGRSRVAVDSSSYEFVNFHVENGFQFVRFDGKISENPSDTLHFEAQNINISPLNMFTHDIGLRLQGVLSADMELANLYENLFVGSKINLKRLTINEQLIGNTELFSEWDPFLEMIHLEWLSTIKDTEVLNIVGDYDPASMGLNFRIFIDRFNLSILEPYLEGVLHDLEGLTTTEIILKGTTSKPELQGVVIFDRTAFTLDYTQTRYEITDWFDIAPDAIYFNDLRLTDQYNNYAHLSGKVTHNNFDDIAIDLNFNSRNLQFLNTRQSDNEVFFGTVFATGNSKITGTLNDMHLDANMRTEKNTKIFIPLESSEEVSEYDFITFKGTTFGEEKEVVEAEVSTSEAFTANMNLNITPEAEVQIIFDSKIGDIVKAKGEADLNVTLSRSGDLAIYGDYIIEKGDYLFTLQDLFQKHLTVAKGSSIAWAGDPMDAVVDIDAIYRVRRASVYDLTFNPDHQELVVPVETHLLMTGGLETPNIGFNLSLPASVKDLQEQLNNLPQEDINKQVLSLLVMNRFLPLPGAQTASKNEDFGMESNASELLSNQVSNWLSQISGVFDIGFNYTPGDEVESQEYEVAVSTQLLNNRVTIQSNVGMGGQRENATDGNQTSNIAGDFQVDVKLSQSGKLRLKAYAKSNEDIYTDAESTQGVGIFYKEEFNTFQELWRKLFGNYSKQNKK